VTILFVSGVNDRSTIGVNLDEEGNPVYLMDGNASVHHRLPLKDGVAASFLIFGKGVKQHSIEIKTPPSLIFNQIADPDTHRGSLERCAQLCEQVNTTVINHPAKVLESARDQVSQKLQGIPGVVMPRIQRFQPRSPKDVLSRAAAEAFDFPFIVRAAGEHGGRRMVRVDKRDDHVLLHALPFDGRDYYLTQYVDYRDDEGLYHKHRIVVIDGEPMFRHLLYSTDWNVHGTSRADMVEREGWEALIAREAKLEQEMLPGVAPACAEIAQRLQLEYFGIDGHLAPDGRLIVFEANANMNLLTGRSAQRAARRERVYHKMHKMLTRYSGKRVI
jgi:glutathione synthase/RimK-type ligase-like ATP-grasp enzyme